jgi:hypothetical protein
MNDSAVLLLRGGHLQGRIALWSIPVDTTVHREILVVFPVSMKPTTYTSRKKAKVRSSAAPDQAGPITGPRKSDACAECAKPVNSWG